MVKIINGTIQSKPYSCFDTYITEKRNNRPAKIKAAIKKRWAERVVAQGLHEQGAAGATQYIQRYGRGIAAPKLIDLANAAFSNGYDEMGISFLTKAYELETGQSVSVINASLNSQVTKATIPLASTESIQIDGLPAHLQPGFIITMQAVDTKKSREEYINDDRYIGQPKRDGQRMVVIADRIGVYYQSRSTTLRETPCLIFEQVLLTFAREQGTFILDGELWYRSVTGSEHRTAAQAARQNAREGKPKAKTPMVYTIFKALYINKQDLTVEIESVRIEQGAWLGQKLSILSDNFEICPTARTTREKQALVARQVADGREGEIWIKSSCTYVGGKKNKEAIVRTKYTVEAEVWVTGLTKTTANGRVFGAIEVSENADGTTSLGKVGTGFSRDIQHQIATRFDEHGAFPIVVEAQGYTETGKLWHARFDRFATPT